ncbi:hypothetical protein [Thalassotalea crassostreae]|uniref:hypothetical protein n=1 Tax=Thalassotalea crassostreae TaxID=1763536 RepID=UPI00083897B7|nr:hypothetical protein [Thalassotalea crassostreae]
MNFRNLAIWMIYDCEQEKQDYNEYFATFILEFISLSLPDKFNDTLEILEKLKLEFQKLVERKSRVKKRGAPKISDRVFEYTWALAYTTSINSAAKQLGMDRQSIKYRINELISRTNNNYTYDQIMNRNNNFMWLSAKSILAQKEMAPAKISFNFKLTVPNE